ncbi:hypothetical protein A9Q86_02485 [Flavobacteriales bacterium 33_180_T64]|nr:hypothetical protein A9Q86_02485 [Flavobacteriales bacterium 33_180_T64]
MDKQQQKLIDQISRRQEKVSKKNYIVGSIIGTLIACTPFIFNLYLSVPEEKVWDTYFFTYDSKYYENANVVAWTLMNKIVPLLLLFIWFFTSRQWWYHALLVPIAMYIYQIIITLNSDLYFVDGNEIIYLLPVMALVIPSIYLIRAQMFNQINDADKSMQELEEEFMMKPKGLWSKIKQYF